VRILVATALIGPTEGVGSGPRPLDVRFICYTDREVKGWERVTPPEGYPRLAARRAKMEVAEISNVDASVWIDASFDLTCDPVGLVNEALATGCDVVGLRHPDRCRIRDEAREIIRCGLAPKDLVDRQVEAYRLAGFDTDENPQKVLTTTGLLVRRHTPAVRAFTRLWLGELERWTIRDQLSIDYTAWRARVPIGYLPGHYRDNPFARYNRKRHQLGRVAA